MARKVKFALEMANGAKVRNSIEELREHFDMGSIAEHYLSGKLLEWLEDRYYDDEAAKIAELDKDAPNLNAQLCAIIGVDPSKFDAFDVEAVARLNEKKAILQQKTSDEAIIANASITALNQEDLADLLDLESPVIYLCGEKFNIPIRVGHKKYVGILGTPKVEIRATSYDDLKNRDIILENLLLPWSNSTPETKQNHNDVNTSVQDVNLSMDELLSIYKSAALERINQYKKFYRDVIWEAVHKDIMIDGLCKRDDISGSIDDAEKKMIVRLIGKNQYSVNDVVHAVVDNDMGAGFLLTKNSICLYDKTGLIKNKENISNGLIIPYNDIKEVKTNVFSITLRNDTIIRLSNTKSAYDNGGKNSSESDKLNYKGKGCWCFDEIICTFINMIINQQ